MLDFDPVADRSTLQLGTVGVPTWGPQGWRLLFRLAKSRGRTPLQQVLVLVAFGLSQAQQGRPTELTDAELAALHAPTELEPSAA